MKPDVKLAEARTTEDNLLSLHNHDGEFSIRYNGKGLMHSRMNASELLIGEMACERLKQIPEPRVLIGGLGLGYTLKAVLDNTPEGAQVHVCELIPEVVEWNRTFMRELNGHLLDDPRVHVHTNDVFKAIKEAGIKKYDSIVLDVDNGPVAMVATANGQIYRRSGVALIKKALTSKGRAAIWSGGKDDEFENVMKKEGFNVTCTPAKTHPKAKGFAYQIYVGDRK